MDRRYKVTEGLWTRWIRSIKSTKISFFSSRLLSTFIAIGRMAVSAAFILENTSAFFDPKRKQSPSLSQEEKRKGKGWRENQPKSGGDWGRLVVDQLFQLWSFRGENVSEILKEG